MLRLRALKYSCVFILPFLAWLGFNSEGIFTFLPVIFAFLFIPALEFLVGASSKNVTTAEREWMRQDRIYDLLLYLTVPVQWFLLIYFLYTIKQGDSSTSTLIGRTLSMGVLCGVIGINVAHELGHHTAVFDRVLAKILLTSSLYMHFYIEHNRGHHRNVGTPEDGATARFNESIYRFFPRTIRQSFISAWQIVKKERKRKGLSTWSLGNEMLQYLLVQITLCIAIAWVFSPLALLLFLVAALVGILLLECVNYIEHYGLARKKVSEFRYEDVQPYHSWNADHIIGRLVLFELTRHSDHHSNPSKHYQLLDSMPTSLQLPAGYPAMMLLSFIPPLWFNLMNPKIENNEQLHSAIKSVQ